MRQRPHRQPYSSPPSLPPRIFFDHPIAPVGMSIKPRAKTKIAGLLPLPFRTQKIEVATFVCLQDGLIEEMGIAAVRPWRSGHWLERRAAPFQFGFIDQKVDAAPFDIEPDHVAV